MQHSEQADGETEENEDSAPAQAERRSGTPSRGGSAVGLIGYNTKSQ